MSTLKVINAAVQATAIAAARVFRMRPARQRRRLRTGSASAGSSAMSSVGVFGVRAGGVDPARLGRCGHDVGRFGVAFGRFGRFRLGRIGVRVHLGGGFDVGGRFVFCGLGLPPQPDRASPGARGGGKRLGLGRLCFCFLRECQCFSRISRLARILRRFVDAISVDDRRAAPERRHSDLLVC